MNIRDIRAIYMKTDDFIFTEINEVIMKEWQGRNFVFDGMIFCFCISGTFSFSINGRQYAIRGGEAAVCLPKNIFTPTGTSGTFEVTLLALNSDYLHSLPLSPDFLQLKRIADYPCVAWSGPELEDIRILNGIMRRYDRNDAISRRLRDSLMLSVLLLIQSCCTDRNCRSGNPKPSRKENMTREFFDLLLKNYGHERRVSFYADELCVSPKTLSDAVKSTTGHTVLEWINEAVVADAKRSLKTTGMTVLQISEQMHFQTLSSFVRFFRQHTGMTPLEYRNNS